jgi:ABC-type sugar transport system ATPase subunit
VEDDLAEVLPPDEKKQIAEIAKLVEIEHLLHRHPYDLNCGSM